MPDESIPPAQPDVLERTRAVVDALKAQNDRAEKILEEQKKFEANKLLGGVTAAGSTGVNPQNVPLTPKEYAKAVMAGKRP